MLYVKNTEEILSPKCEPSRLESMLLWFTNIFRHSSTDRLKSQDCIMYQNHLADLSRANFIVWVNCHLPLPPGFCPELIVMSCMGACVVVYYSVTPCNETHHAPLFMEFFRQEYWSLLSFPPPGDLPNPGIEPASLAPPALAGRFFTTVPLRSL